MEISKYQIGIETSARSKYVEMLKASDNGEGEIKYEILNHPKHEDFSLLTYHCTPNQLEIFARKREEAGFSIGGMDML